ncbi:hypothetical protein [Pseudomonas versuta]|uniref:Uncharacterized protein n=1 Tax=Pseudomonas versuta TaxID=1788301 RepID=A0ABX3EBN3_9PSED|nr:hypothetical protein [Pseudomonas versuta]ALE88871.1 hypothetical protein AOC04_12020 [Pseudomonas versuta]OKA21668.1 hypothetical protein BOH73_10250 [Pseudomonas versuta]
MPDFIEATARAIKIDYLQDTLFGVNALTCECMTQVARIACGWELRLTPPWPSQIKDAHTIAFEWEGVACHGLIKDVQPLPAGELLLAIEIQP